MPLLHWGAHFGGNSLNWLHFEGHGDERGSLVALELGPTGAVPFPVERIYCIYRTELGVARGGHAHRELRQVVIPVAGSCEMVLDDGFNRTTYGLDSPLKGLSIDSMVWREMHNFSADCVLLVLASEHFSESDYVRDYETFLSMVRAKL